MRPYALLPAAHPLAQRPSVSLADLAAEPMVLLDLPGTREHQRGHFAAFRATPLIGHRATSFEMARSLVANGLGYAILVTKPANDMSYSGKALASRPITDELPPVRFVCVARSDAKPKPAQGSSGTFAASFCTRFQPCRRLAARPGSLHHLQP